MSILCCSEPDHPNDNYCYYLKKWFKHTRPRCSNAGRGGVSTPGGSGGTGKGERRVLPLMTIATMDVFIAMPGGPTQDQLLTLVDGLRSEGFNHDALEMTSYIEANTAPVETSIHIRNNLIRGQAFEALNKPEAAKKSFEMVSGWIHKSDSIQIFAQNNAPTSRMAKKLASKKPEELILSVQKYYAKGAYKKALAVTQYIESNVPLGNRYVHIQSNFIRAQAFEKLKDMQAAAASMDTVADLTNMMRDQSQMNMALERATQLR